MVSALLNAWIAMVSPTPHFCALAVLLQVVRAKLVPMSRIAKLLFLDPILRFNELA